jgi:dihydrofolate reductase
MAKLIYMTIASLDGYIADEAGKFDFGVPDDEVFAFVNDFERSIGTYLYGRRLYEVMIGWETAHTRADQSPLELDFARIWQAASKVVYSSTLESPATARTRIERDFDPGAIRQLKMRESRDITVGGADLARQAMKAGLVDEYQLLISPVVLGGGTSSLPGDLRLQLELVSERRFGNGVVHLCYRPAQR